MNIKAKLNNDKVKAKSKMPFIEVGLDKNYDIRCKTLIKSTEMFRIYEAFLSTKQAEVPVFLLQFSFINANEPFVTQIGKKVEVIQKKLDDLCFTYDKFFPKRYGYFIKEEENYVYIIYDKGSFNLLGHKLLNLYDNNHLIKLQILSDLVYYAFNLHKINKKLSLIHPDLFLLNSSVDGLFYFDYIFDEFIKEINKSDNYNIASNIGYLDLDCIEQIDNDLPIIRSKVSDKKQRNSLLDFLNEKSNKNFQFDSDEDIEEIIDKVEEKRDLNSLYFKTDIVMLCSLSVWLFSKKRISNDPNTEYATFEEVLNELKKDFLLENNSFSNLLSYVDVKKYPYIKYLILSTLNLNYKKISTITEFRDKIISLIETELKKQPCVKCNDSKVKEINQNEEKNTEFQDNNNNNNKNRNDKDINKVDTVPNSIVLTNRNEIASKRKHNEDKEKSIANKTDIIEAEKQKLQSLNEENPTLNLSKLDTKNNQKDQILKNQRDILEMMKNPKQNENETFNDISEDIINKDKDLKGKDDQSIDITISFANNLKINEPNKGRFHSTQKVMNYSTNEIICDVCITNYVSTKTKTFKENLKEKYLKYNESYLKIKSIYNSIPSINEKYIKKYFEENVLTYISNICIIINKIIYDISSNNNKVNSLIEYHENLILKLIEDKEIDIKQSLNNYQQELSLFLDEIKKSEESSKHYIDSKLIEKIPKERIDSINQFIQDEDENYELEQEKLKQTIFNLMQKRPNYLIYEQESKEKFNSFYSSVKEFNLLKVSMNFDKEVKIALNKLKSECIGFYGTLNDNIIDFDKILNEFRIDSPYITEKNTSDTNILENIKPDTLFKTRIGAYSCSERVVYVFDSNEKFLNKINVSKIKGINGIILGSKYLNINNKLVITGGVINISSSAINKDNTPDTEKNKEIKSPSLKYNALATKLKLPNLFISDEGNDKNYQIVDFTLQIDLSIIKKGDTSCSFESLPSMKNPRFHHSVVKLNEYSFIVVGGEDCDTCEEYSFLLKKWIEKPKLNISRYHSSLILINGTELYMFFGLIGSRANKGKPSYMIEKMSLYSSKPEWKKISFEISKEIEVDLCLPGLHQVNDDKVIIFGGKTVISKNVKSTLTNFLKFDIKRKYISVHSTENELKNNDAYFDEGLFTMFTEKDMFGFTSEFNLVSFNLDEFN